MGRRVRLRWRCFKIIRVAPGWPGQARPWSGGVVAVSLRSAWRLAGLVATPHPALSPGGEGEVVRSSIGWVGYGDFDGSYVRPLDGWVKPGHGVVAGEARLGQVVGSRKCLTQPTRESRLRPALSPSKAMERGGRFSLPGLICGRRGGRRRRRGGLWCSRIEGGRKCRRRGLLRRLCRCA